MDNGFSRHCPVCLDFFQGGISGQCPDFPLSPWTMSRESMDNVQRVYGQCPGSDCGQCSLSPWTLSVVCVGSLDIVQSIYGHYPDFPLIVNVQGVLGQCPGSP